MSWIVIYFESMGNPALGLSPLLRIRLVDDGSIVAEDTMEEVGGGFYRFDFFDYNITKDYIFLADAIQLITKDRFVEGSTGEYGKITNNISIMSDNVGCRVLLMKKLDTNKLELYDGGNINWILYDDDSITPINTFNAQDKDGLYVLQMNYMASKRSKAIEHG
jgi:hypothetical protein